MPSFSIILTSYNIESYVKESIECIKLQKFTDFECFIVDDGSTDETITIIQQCIQHDDRFALIKQENQGVSVARNTGFDASTGEYVLFLDGDDIFLPDLLASVYKQKKKSCVDIICYNASGFYSENRLLGNPFIAADDLSNGKQFSPKDISDRIFNTFGNNAWTKAYKRSFLVENQLSFDPELRRAQDALFSNTALVLAQSICFLDEVLIHYRGWRPDSITRKAARNPEIWTLFISRLYDLLMSRSEMTLYKESYTKYAVENLLYNLQLFIGEDTFDRAFEAAYKLTQDINLDINICDEKADAQIKAVCSNDSLNYLVAVAREVVDCRQEAILSQITNRNQWLEILKLRKSVFYKASRVFPYLSRKTKALLRGNT